MVQVGIQHSSSLEGAGAEDGRAFGEFRGCWPPVWGRKGTAEMSSLSMRVLQ